MRKFLAVLVLFLVSLGIAFAGSSGQTTWPDKTIHVMGNDLNEIRDRHISTPVYEVTASDSNTIPASHSLVFINPSTGNATNGYTLSTTGAVEGQHLYLFNRSATSTTSTIATLSANTGTAHLLYASAAWRLISDE